MACEFFFDAQSADMAFCKAAHHEEYAHLLLSRSAPKRVGSLKVLRELLLKLNGLMQSSTNDVCTRSGAPDSSIRVSHLNGQRIWVSNCLKYGQ